MVPPPAFTLSSSHARLREGRVRGIRMEVKVANRRRACSATPRYTSPPADDRSAVTAVVTIAAAAIVAAIAVLAAIVRRGPHCHHGDAPASVGIDHHHRLTGHRAWLDDGHVSAAAILLDADERAVGQVRVEHVGALIAGTAVILAAWFRAGASRSGAIPMATNRDRISSPLLNWGP